MLLVNFDTLSEQYALNFVCRLYEGLKSLSENCFILCKCLKSLSYKFFVLCKCLTFTYILMLVNPKPLYPKLHKCVCKLKSLYASYNLLCMPTSSSRNPNANMVRFGLQNLSKE